MQNIIIYGLVKSFCEAFVYLLDNILLDLKLKFIDNLMVQSINLIRYRITKFSKMAWKKFLVK